MRRPYVLTHEDRAFLTRLEANVAAISARLAALTDASSGAGEKATRAEAWAILEAIGAALFDAVHDSLNAPLFVLAPAARARLSSAHSHASDYDEITRYTALMGPVFKQAALAFSTVAKAQHHSAFATRMDAAIGRLFDLGLQAATLHRPARVA